MEKYIVLNEIGSGSYGVVRKVKRKSDNKILICKEIKLEGLNEKEKELIANEMAILKELNHPNIVKQHETIKDYLHSIIYIIMEYCEGGDLDKLILNSKKNRKFLDENLIWDIAIQTLKALDYLHNDKKVLHRDIKPSNIFLDKKYNIKLGDFGLSRKFFTSYVGTILGTPLYMSPEILDNKQYNEKADIWALGCSIYELTTFQPPHYASNQKALKLKVQTEPIKRIDKKYSDDLWNFISKMLTYDYNYRPSTKELINQYNNIMKSKINNNYLDDIQNKWQELLLYEENLKKKEKEQKEKEERFNKIQKEKENQLKNKEKSLYEILNKIQKMEQEQKEKEKQLKMKEMQLQEKERKLKEKEQKIVNNPNLVNNNQINIHHNNNLNNNNLNNLIDLNINNINNNINNNDINNNQINLNVFNDNNQNNNLNNIQNNLIENNNINNNLNLDNMNNLENQLKIKRTIPKIGLKNLGDGSYLNAVLQILGNIEEFCNYFLEPDTMSFIDNVKIEMPLSYEIKEFLLKQYTENGNNKEGYDPSPILKVLYPADKDNVKKRINPNDVLKNILNLINEEIVGNNVDIIKYEHDEFNKNDTITKGMNHYSNMNNSKIFNIFNFFEITSYKCLKCNISKFVFNSVYFLTLNILKYDNTLINKTKEKYTINACIKFQYNFQKEIFCKMCNHNEYMKITSKIYKPPNILLVLIDRGVNLTQNNKLLNIPFLVEEKINLNNFMENKSAQINYELIGIISISVFDKKYVVNCKSYIDNQWYYYNDEKVQPIHFDNVIKSNNNNKYYIPCILIYKLIY